MKNDLIYYTALVIIKIVNALPRTWALKLAGIAGEIWFIVGSRDRNIALRQMRDVLGLTGDELKGQARACFETIIKNFVDVLRMGSWSEEYIGKVVEVEGYEHFLEAYNRGNGVIALTGHIGNFELIAAWFSVYKKHKCSVIGRELYDKRFDKMLLKQRTSFGLENIPSSTSAMAFIRALKDGHAIGVLLDQDSKRVSGYFIDFFGKKALTAAGPIFIARKIGSPVVPMAIYRKNDDTYILRILPELKFDWTDNKEDDIKGALEKCNKATEQLIMYDPLQWVWFHNRWRTRPPSEKEMSA